MNADSLLDAILEARNELRRGNPERAQWVLEEASEAAKESRPNGTDKE